MDNPQQMDNPRPMLLATEQQIKPQQMQPMDPTRVETQRHLMQVQIAQTREQTLTPHRKLTLMPW
jgi:hypothetical protein